MRFIRLLSYRAIQPLSKTRARKTHSIWGQVGEASSLGGRAESLKGLGDSPILKYEDRNP